MKKEGLCVTLGNLRLNSLNIVTVQRKEIASNIAVEIGLPLLSNAVAFQIVFALGDSIFQTVFYCLEDRR